MSNSSEFGNLCKLYIQAEKMECNAGCNALYDSFKSYFKRLEPETNTNTNTVNSYSIAMNEIKKCIGRTKIETIKTVRSVTYWGLRDTKDFVDAVCNFEFDGYTLVSIKEVFLNL